MEMLTFLAQVQQGMPVIDVDGDMIGVVADVRSPKESRPRYQGNPAFSVYNDQLQEVLAPIHDIRREILSLMRQQGYVQIDTGLGPVRYATAEEIAGVTENGVYLSVERDNLLKV